MHTPSRGRSSRFHTLHGPATVRCRDCVCDTVTVRPYGVYSQCERRGPALHTQLSGTYSEEPPPPAPNVVTSNERSEPRQIGTRGTLTLHLNVSARPEVPYGTCAASTANTATDGAQCTTTRFHLILSCVAARPTARHAAPHTWESPFGVDIRSVCPVRLRLRVHAPLSAPLPTFSHNLSHLVCCTLPHARPQMAA